jgi:hypothetical protein
LLLVFSLYCSPHCVVAFFIALLLSFSHWLALLFTLLLFFGCYSILGSWFFMLLFSSSRYSAFLTMLFFVGVFLFVEESCITPLHSFLQELGVVGSRESKTNIFLVNIFLFAYFFFFKN